MSQYINLYLEEFPERFEKKINGKDLEILDMTNLLTLKN